jgi:hypothetical protein
VSRRGVGLLATSPVPYPAQSRPSGVCQHLISAIRQLSDGIARAVHWRSGRCPGRFSPKRIGYPCCNRKDPDKSDIRSGRVLSVEEVSPKPLSGRGVLCVLSYRIMLDVPVQPAPRVSWRHSTAHAGSQQCIVAHGQASIQLAAESSEHPAPAVHPVRLDCIPQPGNTEYHGHHLHRQLPSTETDSDAVAACCQDDAPDNKGRRSPAGQHQRLDNKRLDNKLRAGVL